MLIIQTLIIAAITAFFSYKIWQLDPAKHSENLADAEDTEWLIKTRLREGMITKSAILLLVAVFIIVMTTGSANKPAPELEKTATSLVQNLADGKYAQAEVKFDDVMKRDLTVTKLEQTWTSIISDKGRFIKQTSVRTSNIWPYKMVLVRCKLERSNIVIKVVFSRSQKISGLWISPD